MMFAGLSAEQRQALELLTGDPHGATEQLLEVVHGFDSDMTAGLVGSGLAIAKRETMKAGSRTTDVGQIPPSRRTIETAAPPPITKR